MAYRDLSREDGLTPDFKYVESKFFDFSYYTNMVFPINYYKLKVQQNAGFLEGQQKREPRRFPAVSLVTSPDGIPGRADGGFCRRSPVMLRGPVD